MYLYGNPNDEVRMVMLQAMWLRGIYDYNQLAYIANEYARERRILDDDKCVVRFADKVIYQYIFNKGHSGRGTNFTGRKLMVLAKVLGVDDYFSLDERFHIASVGTMPCVWVGDCGSTLTINPVKFAQEVNKF